MSGPAEVVPLAVPARMVNEVVYCPRLMYLEWVQGEFLDNHFTVDGRTVHKRADRPGGTMPEPSGKRDDKDDTKDERDGEAGPDTDPERPAVARAVWLTSEDLGLTAKIDILESEDGSTVTPVEYKRGRPPNLPEGAYLPERVQLCAQVLLLRAHGYRCDDGVIYFAAARRRVTIAMDEILVAATHEAIALARRVAANPAPPPPLIDSPKCHGCSLAPICLPDEITFLTRTDIDEIRKDAEGAQPGPDTASPAPATDELALRRLHPSRDHRLPLYVQEHGARVGITQGRLRVIRRDGDVVEAQLPHTSQVSLFGYAQITTQALHALFRAQVPVSFFTSGGYFVGTAHGMASKNVELRVAQHRMADRPAVCLKLAAGMVASKIQNSRTLLRRNAGEVDEEALKTLKRQARRAGEAASLEELLGIEGTAARVYFQAFRSMLKGSEAGALGFDFTGRNRRPPRDPVNALLSFAYSLLTRDLAVTLATVGLDPMRGFYHQLRFGRPSLALDLMEELRPIIGDSVVVSAVNNGVIGESDFVRSPVSVTLSSAGRKRFLRAYERRMDQLVTHPVFGYRISYRRVLEVQARLFSRFLLGEIQEYPRFNTR